jgi:hypothetical protein
MFLKIKMSLKESNFKSFEDIQSNGMRVLKGLPECDFQQCSQA